MEGDSSELEEGSEESEDYVPVVGTCVCCGMPVSEGTRRIFYEVQLCAICFHDLELMRLATATPHDDDEALLGLITSDGSSQSPLQLRRVQGLDKFATNISQSVGREILETATAEWDKLDAAGIMTVIISARSIARRGGEDREVKQGTINVLFGLAGLVVRDLFLTAMVRSGAAERKEINKMGDWEYETVEPLVELGEQGLGPEERQWFKSYAAALLEFGGELLSDLSGRTTVDEDHLRALQGRLAQLLNPKLDMPPQPAS
jgi:hypothetical protein